MRSTTVHVSSEIAELKKVIVHRPDTGIARISPKKAEELLFDDIVHLPQMQEEHDIFTSNLKAFVGKENVLYIRDLLFEALESNDEMKDDMIDMIVDFEELPPSYKLLLLDLSNKELAKKLQTRNF